MSFVFVTLDLTWSQHPYYRESRSKYNLEIGVKIQFLNFKTSFPRHISLNTTNMTEFVKTHLLLTITQTFYNNAFEIIKYSVLMPISKSCKSINKLIEIIPQNSTFQKLHGPKTTCIKTRNYKRPNMKRMLFQKSI